MAILSYTASEREVFELLKEHAGIFIDSYQALALMEMKYPGKYLAIINKCGNATGEGCGIRFSAAVYMSKVLATLSAREDIERADLYARYLHADINMGSLEDPSSFSKMSNDKTIICRYIKGYDIVAPDWVR